jgi:fluoroacetyl-CoA thioesterase
MASTGEGSDSMRSIPVGAKGSFSLVVASDHLASRFKDAMLPPVLATPVMIMMMENAALNAIKAYLDEGESAVGVHVNVVHRAATPEGFRVTASAEVTKVDGQHSTGNISIFGSRQRTGLKSSAPAPMNAG